MQLSTSALLRSLLRDELWICGDAMENLFGVGAHHARFFCCPDHHEFEESPQNEWLRNL